MIKNYGIFNNHELDNTLLILLSDEKTTSVNQLNKEVEVLYHNEDICGYRIKNFIRYAKIKYSGIIFLPADPLIDVINSILTDNNLNRLEYKTGSGYITKLNDGVMGVYAKEGTFLRDGTISKGRFCTYHDLYIENDTPNALVEIKEQVLEGIDFFKTEVN